jgi:enoyl-CoA hydratase/carnithine racemase
MSYRAIHFEVSERVAVITLHRPEVRNAFNGVMGRELAEAYGR